LAGVRWRYRRDRDDELLRTESLRRFEPLQLTAIIKTLHAVVNVRCKVMFQVPEPARGGQRRDGCDVRFPQADGFQEVKESAPKATDKA
jgi:hypothetical protein